MDCECLDENGYDLEKLGKKKDICSHATMISDKNLLKFVYLKSSKMISSFEKIENYPQEIQKAFTDYKINDDDYYLRVCNEKLTTEKY